MCATEVSRRGIYILILHYSLLRIFGQNKERLSG